MRFVYEKGRDEGVILEGVSVYEEYRNTGIYNKRERRKEFQPRNDSETSQKKKRNIRKMSNSSLVSMSLESASLTSSLKDSVFGTSLDCLCLWKFIFVFVNLSLSLEIIFVFGNCIFVSLKRTENLWQ